MPPSQRAAELKTRTKGPGFINFLASKVPIIEITNYGALALTLRLTFNFSAHKKTKLSTVATI